MNIQRASEIIKALLESNKQQEAMDLFFFFEGYFELLEQDETGEKIKEFAGMCGYPIACNVRLVG